MCPDTDRSLWLAQVLKSHPEVLEMRERIRGISGVATFDHSIDMSIVMIYISLLLPFHLLLIVIILVFNFSCFHRFIGFLF